MIYKSNHVILSLIFLHQTYSATLSDVLTLNTDPSSSSRVARDNKYYSNRQQQPNQHHQQPIDNQRDATTTTRVLKPEESPEARDYHQETSIGKRCSRCGEDGRSDYYRTSSLNSPRKDYYNRYQDPYETTRSRYDDRYDIYDRNYDPNDYYDYYDRDGYRRPSSYSGYSSGYSTGRDLYERDRYEPRDTRYYSRDNRNNYDRSYDRGYDRSYDRGIGYDNIGYDYRGYDRSNYDRNGYDRNSYDRSGGGYDRYRPYDETYRGTSGFDTSGRGYYYNRPEGGRFGVYASSWGYGRDDRDRYRDPG
nr:putative carbonic anhydrase 2 [Onthophagus taurus]